MILLSTTIFAYVPTLKTGQTKSYDTDGGVVTNDSIKDDGFYQMGRAHIYSRSLGIVMDNATGLEWQDDYSANNGVIKSATWQGAVDYCSDIGLGDRIWRLPTIEELESIVDAGNSPAISKYFKQNSKGGHYWSLTDNSTPDAWTVDLNYGLSHKIDKSMSFIMYVRCVSGGSLESSNFFRNDDTEIVTDRISGLQWEDNTSVKTKKRTWIEAIDYCENKLTLGGYTDWRMPNIKELLSITDRSQYYPTIDNKVFANTSPWYYWSSTTSDFSKGTAFTINFYDGTMYDSTKRFVYYKPNVRCVRGGEMTSSSIEPIFPTIDLPFHSEIKPENFSVYIKSFDNFDDSQLSVAIDDVSVNIVEITRHSDGNISVELPFDFSSGTHTITLQYYDSNADIIINANIVPFRMVDEYWSLEYLALAKVGLAVGFDIKVAGVDFEIGTGISVKTELGLNLNGSTNQLIANSRVTGDYLYGIPFGSRMEGIGEASAFKIKLKDSVGNLVDMEANMLSGDAHIVEKEKIVYYPTKINYPTQNYLLASYIIPEILSALPINLNGIGVSSNYDFTSATPYKKLTIRELEINGAFSFYNAAVKLAGNDGSIGISVPFLNTKLAFPQLNGMKKWVWIKGQENGKKINLIRDEYKRGMTPIELKIADIWTTKPGSDKGNLNYFERGIEKDEYIARLRFDLGSKMLYDDLENDAGYTLNEITYYLSSEDYTQLRDDFSIQSLVKYDFTTPTPIESWLLTNDTGYTWGLLKIEAQAAVGFGGGINLLTNEHERALAGYGYRLGQIVYPIYHNILDKTDPIAFRSVDMRKIKGHDILFQSLVESASDLKEELKKAIIGLVQTTEEIVDTTVSHIKEIFVDVADNSVKVVKTSTSYIVNVWKIAWNNISRTRSIPRELTLPSAQKALINNANLEFVSDVMEIIAPEGTVPSEVIIFPVYGLLDNTGIYQFKNNRWQLITNTIPKEGGLVFVLAENGYYALIKHFVNTTEMYVHAITSLDTEIISTLVSKPQYLSNGTLAAHTDFNISISNAYSIVGGIPNFGVLPFTYSEILQTNSEGILDINLSTGAKEGFANLTIRPVSGYGLEDLQVYVIGSSTLQPIENFDFNISLSGSSLFIGDMIEANVTIEKPYTELSVTITAPDGNISYTLPVVADQGGTWTVNIRATDENGYIHTREIKLRSNYECSYFIDSNSAEFSNDGGDGNITVSSTPIGCAGGSWHAEELSGWITLDGDLFGRGEGVWSVKYKVLENTEDTRTSNINIGHSTFVIDQKKSNNIIPIIQYLLF